MVLDLICQHLDPSCTQLFRLPPTQISNALDVDSIPTAPTNLTLWRWWNLLTCSPDCGKVCLPPKLDTHNRSCFHDTLSHTLLCWQEMVPAPLSAVP